MKFFLLTDDADTCVGMRLAGVDSSLVHDAAGAAEALEKAASEPEIGILFITRSVRSLCPEKLSTLEAGNHPVVVEIPDSRNAGESGSALSDYIRATIGISL